MKKLKGTERQIVFAENIANYVNYQLDQMDNKIIGNAVRALMDRTSKATVIIDLFVDSFYSKNIKAVLQEAFKNLKAGDKLSQKAAKEAIGDAVDKITEKNTDSAFDDNGAGEVATLVKKLVKNIEYLESNVKQGYLGSACDAVEESLTALKKTDKESREKQNFDINSYISRYNECLRIYHWKRIDEVFGWLNQTLEEGYWSGNNEERIKECIEWLKKNDNDNVTKINSYQEKLDKLKTGFKVTDKFDTKISRLRKAASKGKWNEYLENTVKEDIQEWQENGSLSDEQAKDYLGKLNKLYKQFETKKKELFGDRNVITVSYDWKQYDENDIFVKDNKAYKVVDYTSQYYSAEWIEDCSDPSRLDRAYAHTGNTSGLTNYNYRCIDISDTQEGIKALDLNEKEKQEEKRIEEANKLINSLFSFNDPRIELKKLTKEENSSIKNARIIWDTTNIYGSGNEIRLDIENPSIAYALTKNSMDGDDWSQNNFPIVENGYGDYIATICHLDTKTISDLKASCELLKKQMKDFGHHIDRL